MVIIVEISMVNQIKNDSYMTTTIVLFDNVTRKVASQGGFFYGVVMIFLASGLDRHSLLNSLHHLEMLAFDTPYSAVMLL